MSDNKVNEQSKEAERLNAPLSVKICLVLQSIDTIFTYALGIYIFTSEMNVPNNNSSTVFITGGRQDSETNYKWMGLIILIVHFIFYLLAIIFGKGTVMSLSKQSQGFCPGACYGLFGLDTIYILLFKDNYLINEVCCYGACVLMVSYTLKLYTISIIGFDNNIYIFIIYLFSLLVTAFSLSILHINWSFENIYLVKQKHTSDPNRKFLIDNKQYILLFIMYVSDLFVRSIVVMMILSFGDYNWIYYCIWVAISIILLFTYYSIHHNNWFTCCMEINDVNETSRPCKHAIKAGPGACLFVAFSIVVLVISVVAMMNTMAANYVSWGYLKICKIITFISNSVIGLAIFIVFIVYSIKTKQHLDGFFWFIILFWTIMYILFNLSYLCYNYRYNEIYKEKLKEKEIEDEIEEKEEDERLKNIYGVTGKELQAIYNASYRGEPLSDQQQVVLWKSIGFKGIDANIYDDNNEEIEGFLNNESV
eukprot:157636_1